MFELDNIIINLQGQWIKTYVIVSVNMYRIRTHDYTNPIKTNKKLFLYLRIVCMILLDIYDRSSFP